MTKDPGAIQKAADFVQAFMLGFEVEVCAVHSGKQIIWEVKRDLCPIARLHSILIIEAGYWNGVRGRQGEER